MTDLLKVRSQHSGVPVAALRQVRVAPGQAQYIKLGLALTNTPRYQPLFPQVRTSDPNGNDQVTVTCQVDDPGGQVQVHHVIDNAALNVTTVLVDKHLFSRVEDFQETEVRLDGLVERLVLIFVMLDPSLEVVEDFDHRVALHVVWAMDFDLDVTEASRMKTVSTQTTRIT